VRPRTQQNARSALAGSEEINTLTNIEAFILVSRLRSFTAAARELGIAPSVVTKRITQLEVQMGGPLLIRSTRGLALTASGERCLPRFLRLRGEIAELLNGAAPDEQGIEGQLRIKSPTTVAAACLGALLSEFQVCHPAVSLDLVIMDRSVNPLEEGFDLVVGARPVTYPNVVDIPLCPYPIVLCATPDYLGLKGIPQHPSELVDYDCLTSALFGTTWLFEGSAGALSVEVHSRFHANDSRVLLEATRRSLGLAMLPRYVADPCLSKGELVATLPHYPIASFWLKALVPRIKMRKPAVRELVSFLKTRMHPSPWTTAA
jgi:DNA-binding transcriptional LysR family regulator